jgi:hypothetical protein
MIAMEVTLVAPPGASPVKIALTSSSSAATANGIADAGGGHGWLTLCCDVPCHLHFGSATMDAATTSHMLLPANTWVPLHVLKSEGYVRAIRAGSDDGSLWIYRSSR